jgi:hypothetical protein
MSGWLLTVVVARGPAPVVTRLIDLAGRRPVAMGGDDITVANFAYGTERDAREASQQIQGAGLGASCSVASFHARPSLGSPRDDDVSLDEKEEFEEERREEVIHAIALRNAAGRMDEMP